MAEAARTESTWRRIYRAPLHAGALALFVAAPFAGTAISQFIDCGDAFWNVACGIEVQNPAPSSQPDAAEPQTANLEPEEVLGITVVIDSVGDPTCRTLDNGFIVCNS